MSLLGKLTNLYSFLTKGLNWSTHIVHLILRVWLFYDFFWRSGLSKLKNWEGTLKVFEYEYEVPLLPSDVAAYLGTAAELILPAMLLVGIFSRFSAVGFFIFNLVAVFSYPFLWGDSGQAGFNQHMYWGFMILILMLHGPGKISIDFLLNRKCEEYKY